MKCGEFNKPGGRLSECSWEGARGASEDLHFGGVGLSASEERDAMARGFAPLSLGSRVLRAETAALVALVKLAG